MKRYILTVTLLVILTLLIGCGSDGDNDTSSGTNTGDVEDEENNFEKVKSLGLDVDSFNKVKAGLNGEAMVNLLIKTADHLKTAEFDILCEAYDHVELRVQTTYEGKLTKLTVFYQQDISNLERYTNIGELTVIPGTQSVNLARNDCGYVLFVNRSGIKETYKGVTKNY